jgi:hypothetical protein
MELKPNILSYGENSFSGKGRGVCGGRMRMNICFQVISYKLGGRYTNWVMLSWSIKTLMRRRTTRNKKTE